MWPRGSSKVRKELEGEKGRRGEGGKEEGNRPCHEARC